MKKDSVIDKINNYYKYFIILIVSIFLYWMIMLFKSLFYGLFDLSINNFSGIERKLIDITYGLFAIIMAVNFFIKNINSKLDDFKSYMKQCGIGLATIIVYSLTSFLELVILYYMRVDVGNLSIKAKSIYFISCEILILGIICLINGKKLEQAWKNFKINFKDYIDKYFKYYLISIIVMFISNIFINLIYPSVAGNQASIVSILKRAPIYMVFSSVIFAPIVEELVFRLSIKRMIKDNLVFIIASGLIFGGMHVAGNISNFYDVLYIIPYSAPGIAFAYILSKSDNIFIPISLHFLHNSIMMFAQIVWIFIL